MEVQTIDARQVGIGVDLQQVQNLLDETRSGSFVCIQGYVSKESEKDATDNGTGEVDASKLEVVDHWVQHGVDYGRVKERSEAIVRAMIEGEGEGVHVVHGFWIEPETLSKLASAEKAASLSVSDNPVSVKVKVAAALDGWGGTLDKTFPLAARDFDLFVGRKSKSRIQGTVSYDLPSGHPLLVAAAEAALEGILAPKPVDQGYEKYAKGGYYRGTDGEIQLYLRDCLRVHRVVRKEGEHRFKASAPKTAIRAAVERLTPKGRYRAMAFAPLAEGTADALGRENRERWTSITMGGQSILMDGVDESLYFALPEHAHAALEVAGESA